MRLKDLTIGFALTGSFCTIKETLETLKTIVNEGANVIPILSEVTGTFDTRFTNAKELREELEKITGNKVLQTIPEVEPIGPKALLDVIIVAPCTGNTAAKLANAITDTSVTMAVKAHLRNEKVVVLSIATNDGLGANLQNIGILLNTKNIYLVPFYQDDYVKKTKSLVANQKLIIDTVLLALEHKQIQPILHIK